MNYTHCAIGTDCVDKNKNTTKRTTKMSRMVLQSLGTRCSSSLSVSISFPSCSELLHQRILHLPRCLQKEIASHLGSVRETGLCRYDIHFEKWIPLSIIARSSERDYEKPFKAALHNCMDSTSPEQSVCLTGFVSSIDS